MAETQKQPNPPVHAGPVRRVVHTLVALAGWVLFAYWWWLVSRRVSQHEIRFTLLLIAIALVIIVFTTAAWAVHNVLIFRTRGPRLHLREVTQDFSHDTVGREVEFPTVPEDCRTAPVVNVRLQNGAKVYVPATTVRGTPGDAGRSVRP